MKVEDKIRKRIKTKEMIKNDIITQIQITKEEAKELGKKRKIDGIDLIVVDKLGEMTKKDCKFYKNNECKALTKLYCENENCKFYKPRRKENDY